MNLPQDDEYVTPTTEDVLTYFKTYPLSLNDNNMIKTLIFAIENDINKEDDIKRNKIKEELQIKLLKFN